MANFISEDNESETSSRASTPKNSTANIRPVCDLRNTELFSESWKHGCETRCKAAEHLDTKCLETFLHLNSSRHSLPRSQVDESELDCYYPGKVVADRIQPGDPDYHNSTRQDCEAQLMSLEQQNKKRPIMHQDDPSGWETWNGLGTPTTENKALHDYKVQLMLLEQQNKRRRMTARQDQAATGGDEPRNEPDIPTTPGDPLHDYHVQLMLLEQQNKKRLMMARQDRGATSGDEPQIETDFRATSQANTIHQTDGINIHTSSAARNAINPPMAAQYERLPGPPLTVEFLEPGSQIGIPAEVAVLVNDCTRDLQRNYIPRQLKVRGFQQQFAPR